MLTREEILKRNFSEPFIQKMRNAIETSYYKYGVASLTYPELAQAYKCIKQRLKLYEETHNTEYLVDVVNFAMLNLCFQHSRIPSTLLQIAINRLDLLMAFPIKN